VAVDFVLFVHFARSVRWEPSFRGTPFFVVVFFAWLLLMLFLVFLRCFCCKSLYNHLVDRGS